MPPSARSNPVSDREDDLDDDEDGPEIDDSDILADLPDDTDVRRPASPPQLLFHENAQSLIASHLRVSFV